MLLSFYVRGTVYSPKSSINGLEEQWLEYNVLSRQWRVACPTAAVGVDSTKERSVLKYGKRFSKNDIAEVAQETGIANNGKI